MINRGSEVHNIQKRFYTKGTGESASTSKEVNIILDIILIVF